MIYTNEQKTEMQRLKEEEGLSFAEIADRFGLTGPKRGDNIRKVLARFCSNCGKPLHTTPEAKVDSLRRLHDEFDAKVPGYSASRPKWAGHLPLRITPKDFQR